MATITNAPITNKIMAIMMEEVIAESMASVYSKQEAQKRGPLDTELDKRFAQYITEGLYGK